MTNINTYEGAKKTSSIFILVIFPTVFHFTLHFVHFLFYYRVWSFHLLQNSTWIKCWNVLLITRNKVQIPVPNKMTGAVVRGLPPLLTNDTPSMITFICTRIRTNCIRTAAVAAATSTRCRIVKISRGIQFIDLVPMHLPQNSSGTNSWSEKT